MLGKLEILGVRARDAGIGERVADEVDGVGIRAVDTFLKCLGPLAVVLQVEYALDRAMILRDEPMKGVVERVHGDECFGVCERLAVGDGKVGGHI